MEKEITNLLDALIKNYETIKKIPYYPYCVSKTTKNKGVLLKPYVKDRNILYEELLTMIKNSKLINTIEEEVNYSKNVDDQDKVYRTKDIIAYLPTDDQLKKFIMETPEENSRILMNSPLSPMAMGIISQIRSENDKLPEVSEEFGQRLDDIFGDMINDENEVVDSEETIIDTKLNQLLDKKNKEKAAGHSSGVSQEETVEITPLKDINLEMDISEHINEMKSLFEEETTEEKKVGSEKLEVRSEEEITEEKEVGSEKLEVRSEEEITEEAENIIDNGQLTIDNEEEEKTEKVTEEEKAEEIIAPTINMNQEVSPSTRDIPRNEVEKSVPMQAPDSSSKLETEGIQSQTPEQTAENKKPIKSKFSDKYKKKQKVKKVKKVKIKKEKPEKEKRKKSPVLIILAVIFLVVIFVAIALFLSKTNDKIKQIFPIKKRVKTVKVAKPDTKKVTVPIKKEEEIIKNFYVQAGSYTKKESALEEVSKFEKIGYNAVIVEVDINETRFFRVRITGSLSTREKAMEKIKKIKSAGWKEDLYPFLETGTK